MNTKALDTGIKLIKNVGHVNFGRGCLDELPGHLAARRARARNAGGDGSVVFLVDEFFRDRGDVVARLGIEAGDAVRYVATVDEPTTEGIDGTLAELTAEGFRAPAAVVGFGGGITMDTAKAISNLMTNGGRAEDYQGWDLVRVPGIPKLGIPTISGTGAEATRTCVMTNARSGLKLGMNSDFTVFDHILLDPDLTATVARDQYFFTGMDAYIHCVESLAGSYRNAIGDGFSHETLKLCRDVFLRGDMMEPGAREKLMVASYFGGCAIAASYVGLVHPLSAGLSVVLGVHHCVGNCIAMRAVEAFYPAEFEEFWRMAEQQRVEVPQGLCRNLSENEFEALYKATIIHRKPLTNALGEDFERVLTQEKVTELFLKM